MQVQQDIATPTKLRGETSAIAHIDELGYLGNPGAVVIHEDESVKVTAVTTVSAATEHAGHSWTADINSAQATAEHGVGEGIEAPNELMSPDQLTAVEAHIATKMLEQNGWAILDELFRTTGEAIGHTKFYVLPTLVALPKIKGALGEHGESFVTMFTDLQGDIETISQALLSLRKEHAGKVHLPTPDEFVTISNLADAYNNLMHQLDIVVGQKVLEQLAILDVVGLGSDHLAEIYMELASQVATVGTAE